MLSKTLKMYCKVVLFLFIVNINNSLFASLPDPANEFIDWLATGPSPKDVVDRLSKLSSDIITELHDKRNSLNFNYHVINKANLSWDQETPLVYAINEGDIETAKRLMDLGADINYPQLDYHDSKLSPLLSALRNVHEAIG